MSTEILDQLTVLADATRTRLLSLLEHQEITVSELCDVLQLPQSTVSRHLKTLADAGWISSRREGTSRYYALSQEEVNGARHKLWRLVAGEMEGSAAATQDNLRLQQVLARRRSRSEQFFSSSAHQWDSLRDELFGACSHLRPLLAWLDEEWVVGDLGCGTGRVSEAIAGFVGKVIAVDASAEMLEAARSRLQSLPNVELQHGALERLPVAEGILDAACLMLVLHHVPDPGKVLAAAANALRPGAKLLVVDMLPHDHEEYRSSMGHIWLGFSERQMARLLSAAGFGSMRWQALAPDTEARGPALFAAVARKDGRPTSPQRPLSAGEARS